MVALRVISDAANDDVPEALLTTVDAFGRPRYGALLGCPDEKSGRSGCRCELAKRFPRGLRHLIQDCGDYRAGVLLSERSRKRVARDAREVARNG